MRVAPGRRAPRAALSVMVIGASMVTVLAMLEPAGASPALPGATPGSAGTPSTSRPAGTSGAAAPAVRASSAVLLPACGEPPTPPSVADAFDGLSTEFGAAEAATNTVAAVASGLGDGAAAAGLGSLGSALGIASTVSGYAFAGAAFSQANAAFGYGAHDPLDRNFKVIFMPVFASIPVVAAPKARLDGAFTALNKLFDTESRFADIVVALRTALNRVAGATAAGNQLWLGRQADASANYALEAAELLQEFSPLRAAIVKTFTAEGLSMRLTLHQFTEAQADVARGLPSAFTEFLKTAAAALQPQSSTEVKALTSILLDTKAIQKSIAAATPRSLDLPTVFGSPLLTSAEARLATGLSGFANYVLQSPNKIYHPDYRIAYCGGGGGGGGGGGSGASYGEPHENTFAGDDYEFQAVGEFTLVKSTTDNLDIQIRQQPFPGAGDVSMNTATAMTVGKTIVELAANTNGLLQLWVDRKPVPFATQSLAGGGELSVNGGRFATVTWPDGTQVTVFSTVSLAVEHATGTCNSSRVIYVFVKVPRSQYGHLTGLLGDAGQPAGSNLLGGNGVSYSLDQLEYPSESTQNFDVLYHQFGQSWRVTQATSLFAYPKGQSTASYTDLSFPDKALTVRSLTPTTASAAKTVCRSAGITNPDLLSDCVFDLGVTGSRCFAAGEAQVQASTGGPKPNGMPPSSGGLVGAAPTSPAATTTTTSATTATTKPASSGQGPVAIGTSSGSALGQPAVAVSPSGTAYSVVLQGNTKLDVCKLPPGSTTCNPVVLKVPDPSTYVFFDPPTVLVQNGDIYVFEYLEGASDDLTGLAEFVSTDGGASFTLQPHAVSYVPGGAGTAGPVVALPGGDFGAGYVSAVANPAFQANALSSPGDDSEATTPAYATLNPSPATAYTIGNLGGQFASQLTGSLGVLGVFQSSGAPCPSSARATLVYAYAPIAAATTLAELNTSPGGAGSPWSPLAKVDCEGAYPALAGGPSGLGLLESDLGASSAGVLYRAFSPTSGFGAPVTIVKGEIADDPTVSQDGTGGIYATWVEPGVGIELAYSSTRGASWTGPISLLPAPSGGAGMDNLTSAVNGSGQGWAVYTLSGKEYALHFTRSGS